MRELGLIVENPISKLLADVFFPTLGYFLAAQGKAAYQVLAEVEDEQ